MCKTTLRSLMFFILYYSFVRGIGNIVSSTKHKHYVKVSQSRKIETGTTLIPVVDSDTISRIKKDGYKVEAHTVQTADGYILTMHRIPKLNSTKPPIYLQHGLLCTSSVWILSGPGKGLAYILSDAGYDVWMGNNRGNTYSKKHAWLNPKTKAYWNFSLNEIGIFDVSAMIDYILSKTGENKLQYIGHSQGTTVFFILTSSKPEYNEKVISNHELGPVVFMENAKSPIVRVICPIIGNASALNEFFASTEVLPSSDFVNKLGSVFCKDNSPIQEVCANIMFLSCGYDTHNLNRTMIPDIIATFPAGASSNQFVHYAQIYMGAHFRMFDYGFIRNEIEYGSFEPPKYDLHAISTPTALYYGDNDLISDVKDVKRLAAALGNMQILYRVQHDKWNHLDFLFAVNVREDLYNKLIEDLQYFQYNIEFSRQIEKKLRR